MILFGCQPRNCADHPVCSTNIWLYIGIKPNIEQLTLSYQKIGSAKICLDYRPWMHISSRLARRSYSASFFLLGIAEHTGQSYQYWQKFTKVQLRHKQHAWQPVCHDNDFMHATCIACLRLRPDLTNSGQGEIWVVVSVPETVVVSTKTTVKIQNQE